MFYVAGVDVILAGGALASFLQNTSVGAWCVREAHRVDADTTLCVSVRVCVCPRFPIQQVGGALIHQL